MNSNPKIKNFEIFPIGKTKIEKGCSFICVFLDYRDALKHLGLFSHAIIFLFKNDKFRLETVKILLYLNYYNSDYYVIILHLDLGHYSTH